MSIAKRFALLVAIGCLGVAPSIALAAPLYDWPAVPTITDPDDAIPGAMDILAAWHVHDGGFHYFRMDLEAAPGSVPGESPEIYGIYMDTGTGGGSNAFFEYIPDSIVGIDFIVDSHYDVDAGAFWRHDYHTYSPYIQWFNYRPLADDEHQESGNAGATLEWKITDADIGSEFTWWAANLSLGLPSTTHDITDPVVVPEPAGLGLLGFGGLVLLRRRRIIP